MEREQLWRVLSTLAVSLLLLGSAGAFSRGKTAQRDDSNLSSFCPTNISGVMQLVNNYWLSQHRNPPPGKDSLTWGNATYWSGNLAAFEVLGRRQYYEAAQGWAQINGFNLETHPTNPVNALGVGYVMGVVLWLVWSGGVGGGGVWWYEMWLYVDGCEGCCGCSKQQ